MIYNFLSEYLSIIIFLFISIFLSIGFVVANYLASPSNPDPEKLSAYECGSPPLMEANERFSVRFYLLGILFLLFDVEAMFLFPWAVKYDALGLFGFVEMMLFILVLLVGYFYAWKKGALEWA